MWTRLFEEGADGSDLLIRLLKRVRFMKAKRQIPELIPHFHVTLAERVGKMTRSNNIDVNCEGMFHSCLPGVDFIDVLGIQADVLYLSTFHRDIYKTDPHCIY